MVELRAYERRDALPLLELFRDTIRRSNSGDYTPEQIAAWASDEIDGEAWAQRFEGRFVRVAVEDGRCVGFAELEPSGRIDRMYVSPDVQGSGVGRRLLQQVLAEAQRRGVEPVTVDASITARPFFERNGFVTLAQQQVTLREVAFVNYRMERPP